MVRGAHASKSVATGCSMDCSKQCFGGHGTMEGNVCKNGDQDICELEKEKKVRTRATGVCGVDVNVDKTFG